jgi:hypothetical protein
MPGLNSTNWKPRPLSNDSGAWIAKGGRDFSGSFVACTSLLTLGLMGILIARAADFRLRSETFRLI